MENHQLILVLDFGGQYNQLIARRVREHNVFCEVKPYKTSIEEIKAMNPIGIIFTGGPNSVYEETASPLVKQYQTMFEMDGVKLNFEPEALIKVAETALERKTGARGLRGVLENVMTDIMFSIPSDKTVSSVTITPEVVMGTGEPVVEHDAMPVDPEPPKKRTRKTTKSA